MQPLELIRTAHEIDRRLAEISAAVTDEALKRDLGELHARWRELGYRVTADLCGLEPNEVTVTPKRRGRRRRIDGVEASTDIHNQDDGAGS
jgi:hypothetical protein